MKRQSSAHNIIYLLLTVWVIAVAALTFTACGAADEAAHTAVSVPAMRLYYTDEEIPCSVTLTPSSHEMNLSSTGELSPSTAIRPCGQVGLSTFYSADPEGIARLAYYPDATPHTTEDAAFDAAAAIPALTVTAYPAAEDDITVDLSEENRQTVTVTDGQFTLLMGRYYYEVETEAVTYGFLCYRTEEYWIKETHLGGCLYDMEYEDPNIAAKQIPSPSIMENPMENRTDSFYGHGVLQKPYGSFEWDYVNHMGTTVTAYYSDIPTPEPIYRNTIYLQDVRDTLRLWFYNGSEPDSYTITRFPLNDLDVLCEAFYGEQPYEVLSWANGFQLKLGKNYVTTYGDAKCQDGKWLGELEEVSRK